MQSLYSLSRVLYIQNNLYSFRNYCVASDNQKHYEARKLLGFSTDELYEVVADIKNYDKFLPFCTKSTILSNDPQQCIANLEIGFPPIVENYTSIVKLIESNLVRARCFDGRLFHYLESTWVFNPALESNPRTCLTDYSLKFCFKSKLYSHIASVFFKYLVQEMENAFINEAVRRYGQPSISMYKLSPASISPELK
ncbi:coenzyme Q-binding protein COQ10 homolog B, mitochondrial-like isoform X1 [Diabrotica virgifera virgifera]|uniref:Coenzyme Q-binding protein COQ10 START domain-containing protein n=1 Tax=Diabrotica virgifera virgifera TaxID=50390 RepID=A0ABM5IEV5_DIAVI|nr:coenzyme Q-binding protein COQ10 homolog B, mitochondrial-like isoform X1 [Diabrotica virgifera virgifera]